MTVPLADVPFGSISPPMAIALAIVVAMYWRRVRTLAGEGRGPRRWRQLSFYASSAILLLGPLSPLGADDEQSFVSHMIEHLLIGDVAALLMVLGLTGPVLQPVLRIGAISKLRALSHPLVALPLWIANIYIWHIPALFESALTSDTLHVVQHMLFFGIGVNMWMPLFGPLPTPSWFNNLWKLGYIVGVRLAGVLLGNVFVFSGTVFYDQYEHGSSFWGLAPLADQSTAGAVMMIEGSVIGFGLFAWLFVRAAREGERAQDLIDYAAARGVEISPQRGARAAAAGTTDLIRSRIDGRDTDGDDGDNRSR